MQRFGWLKCLRNKYIDDDGDRLGQLKCLRNRNIADDGSDLVGSNVEETKIQLIMVGD